MAGLVPIRIRIGVGQGAILPLPLREGVVGRGGTNATQGGGIDTKLACVRFPPPPTPSRKGRGRTPLQRHIYPDAFADCPGHDAERAVERVNNHSS